MKKERIKTVVLCLLILNCIQLTGRIWLDKKLWPAGYNFFHYAGNMPVIGNLFGRLSDNFGIADESVFNNAIMPRRIIAGDGSGRSVLYENDEKYKEIIKITSGVLKNLDSDTSSDTINREQIEKYLVNKSAYFDYGYTAGYDILLEGFDIKDENKISGKTSADSIIFAIESPENKISVCFVSPDGESAVRYRLNTSGDKLAKQIDGLKLGRTKRYAFAFDLNLHENVESGNALRLSPFVVLNTDETEGESVTVSDCFKDKKSLSDISDKIVTSFGYNPSSLRKAVSNRGTVRYIENNATVNVYPDGIVEYSAAASGMGIKINNPQDVKSVIRSVISVALHIFKTADLDGTGAPLLSGDVSVNRDGNYELKLDYYINGIPVKFGENGESAVESVIENGFIKEFKMHLVNISPSEEKATWTSVLDAINIYADRNTKRSADEMLTDMYECYGINGGKASSGWFIQSSEGQTDVVCK